MTTAGENQLILKHFFDPHTKRHYQNGHLTVLHCHHYSTLYTQLAMDAGETDLLVESAQESFHEVLNDYFQEKGLTSKEARTTMASQYFAAMGLGKMQVMALENDGGQVELLASHVDSGWLKKWGPYSEPVNYISSGYIAAMFCAVLGMPLKTFLVREEQSIVMGAKTSIFTVVKR